ncbi:MAG: sigma-70 family RNA polymerase sigma factor [Iamia sp.]
MTPSTDLIDAATARRTAPRSILDSRSVDGVDPEVWALHVRYQRTQAPEDLAALAEEYRAYAASLARRMYREGVPLEDLRQVAMEALVMALQRFDCERGIPFCGFASPTILGALKRHYRDHGWAVRIPRSLQDLAVPARDAADRLASNLGRTPQSQEVADEVGIDVDLLRQVETATHARKTSSLDAPPRDGLASMEVAVVDRELGLVEDLTALSEAVHVLDDRSRQILSLYFFEEKTQTEIAEAFDVSQMQVSRWLRSALDRLRSHLTAG